MINVSLAQSVRVQEQVVVIGYGTASKRDLTGSIVKVSGKEVADKPNTNPKASSRLRLGRPFDQSCKTMIASAAVDKKMNVVSSWRVVT